MYDIHLSQNMMDDESADKRAYTQITNHEAILRKYNISQAEWDSSYNYYCRHADKLHRIYMNLSERIRNEVIDLGGDVSLDEASISGDTANIWNSERNFILMQQAPYNLNQFAINADSTFKAGDILNLQFDTKFIFQEGNRNLVAVLAVTLGNDSVVSVTRHVNYENKAVLTFSDSKRLGIKDVRGYFVLLRSINEQVSTAFHLVSVENIKLILAHSKDEPLQPDEPQPIDEKDSIKTDTAVRPVPGRLVIRTENRPSGRLVAP